MFYIFVERRLDTENIVEHNLHALVATGRERFATVRLHSEAYIHSIDDDVLCATNECHLLHLLGDFALDAIRSNAIVAIHHLEDALLCFTGDAVFVAREDKNLVIGQFLACSLHLIQHSKVVIWAVDVCTTDVLWHGLGTSFGKEVDGLEHVVAFNKL